MTSSWPAPPRADPESRLTGAMYNCFARTRTAGVVVDPDNFLFQGSGATRGLALPTLIGPEIDRMQLRNPTPRPLEALMHSPFPCPGAPRSSSDATYYTTGSGAGVCDSGTIDWVRSLTAHGPTTVITARVVKAVTDILLLTFSRGPAGKVHLARDNLRPLGIS